jgi:hypothetical protein
MGWVLVRAFGIIVGIATLLRLATTEKLVTYEPLFQQWLEVLTEFVDHAFLIKFIGPGLLLAIDYVRSFGISVPDLQDEWQPTFVLSTLMLGALARNFRTGWFVVAAPCLALACAVVAGLTGSLAPVLFACVLPPTLAIPARTFAVAVALTTALAASAYLDAASFTAFGAAVFFAAIAAGGVYSSIRYNWRDGYRAVFADPTFNTGFDVLAAMLGALGLASLFASPPIW